jgi:hypothetical protein
MGAGGVQPDRYLPGRAEVLHESDRTRVTRLFFDGHTVIRKEPLEPDAPRRLQHELAILERLRGVSGVAQLVEAPRYPGSRRVGWQLAAVPSRKIMTAGVWSGSPRQWTLTS